MAGYYEYQLFFGIARTASAERPPLPALPAGIHAHIREAPETPDAWRWECALAMGHSRTELESLVKWFREDLAALASDPPQIFDPQLGRSLFFHRDGDAQDFVDSVCNHDAWVLNHVGGDSLHVEPISEGMPVRTRMLLILAGLLVALYLLTNFMLDLYFR